MLSKNKPGWLFLLLAMLAALSLLVAACGGDDDDSGDDSGDEPTASEDAGDDGGDDDAETPEGDDDDDEETPAGDDDDDDTDDIFSQLDDLTGDLELVTGKVTYNVSNEDGTTTTMTFYSKAPNSRFDTTDGDTISTIITTPDATYICDSSSESCFSTPGSGDDTSGLGLFGAFLSSDVIRSYVAAAEASGVDVDQSDESINGIDASCFSWEGSTEDDVDEGKICFNDDGLMVFEEFTGDTGTTSFEATDFSSDVSDSDFEPPYEVADLGDFGQ